MSFGEELRRERELRQISLREVAKATKIKLRYLEAMERNDFSYLPGGLFNRGFVRAYSKHIGVDPEDMVNAYLLEERAQTETGAGAMEDRGLLRGPAVRAGAESRPVERAKRDRRRRRWLLALVLAAVVLATGTLVTLWFLGGIGGSAASGSSRAQPVLDVREEGGRT
jgi:cytoskeletal protein RodZ